jgi:hypothetical protein
VLRQFPSAIEGGKNQELHTRLLHEPMAVPDLGHTGIKVTVGVRAERLFYPNGRHNPAMGIAAKTIVRCVGGRLGACVCVVCVLV